MELLIFTLADEHFGIPADAVREILRAATFAKIADVPGVEGALDVRGQVLPVVDLRGLVGVPSRPLVHTDHLVVLGNDDQSLGVIRVDRALRLDRFATETIEPQPQLGMTQLTRCFVRSTEGLIRVLDVDQLLRSIEHLRGQPGALTNVAETNE